MKFLNSELQVKKKTLRVRHFLLLPRISEASGAEENYCFNVWRENYVVDRPNVHALMHSWLTSLVLLTKRSYLCDWELIQYDRTQYKDQHSLHYRPNPSHWFIPKPLPSARALSWAALNQKFSFSQSLRGEAGLTVQQRVTLPAPLQARGWSLGQLSGKNTVIQSWIKG